MGSGFWTEDRQRNDNDRPVGDAGDDSDNAVVVWIADVWGVAVGIAVEGVGSVLMFVV